MSSGERWLPERVCADRFVAVRQSRRVKKLCAVKGVDIQRVRAHRETTPISRSVVAISGRRTAEIANDFYF